MYKRAVVLGVIYQMDLQLQYEETMMSSSRRKPQPPTSGPSMIGAQNRERPPGAAEHVHQFYITAI